MGDCTNLLLIIVQKQHEVVHFRRQLLQFLNLIIPGAFFLLSCARDNTTGVKNFLEQEVVSGEAVTKYEAIQRFVVLWQTRYKVWPCMEERAQKKFNMEGEKAEEGQVRCTVRSLWSVYCMSKN